MQYVTRFICLVTLALISSAGPASSAVTLVVVGEKPFLHAAPVLVDGEVYASLPALNAVGARFYTDRSQARDGQEVEITPATEPEFTCPARLINGTLMVPIRSIAPQLGAVARWDEASKTLNLRARIRSIEFDGSELKVSASYPVTYEIVWWKAANKLILDVRGVEVPVKSSDLRISNSTPVRVRVGAQNDGQTARIVLDLPCPVKWQAKSPAKTSEIIVAISGYSPAKTPKPGVAKPSIPGTEVTPLDTSQPPVGITSIDYAKQTARRVEVYIDADGPIKYETSMTRDPDELIVDIGNAVLTSELDDIPVGHQILQGIRIEQPDGNVRIIMDLTRVVGFDIAQDEASNRLKVVLEMPKGAGGPLAGKTIVLDPGHGGRASGAVGLDGGHEKVSNLSIAKRVRKLLLDAGVCAILTRSSDKPLDEDTKQDLIKRAEFAARHSADAFLSIHSNSIAGPKCPTGLETYYHGRDMSGRALAYCVHSEIVRAGLLPDLRPRSDFMLYQTGLGVLRNAVERFGIPSALIEVGYVKHPDDLAKIRSPKFQEKVAEAIVRGFKLYFEGNAPPASRVEPAVSQESEPVAEKSPQPSAAKKPSPSKAGAPKRPGVK